MDWILVSMILGMCAAMTVAIVFGFKLYNSKVRKRNAKLKEKNNK